MPELKKILSLALALCILLQSFSKVWVVLSFKIQQDYIAGNLCVNRNMPAPEMCSGKCYLNEQLKKASEEEHSDFPIGQFSKSEVVHFAGRLWAPGPTRRVYALQAVIFPPATPFPAQLFIHDIFHPPQG